MVHKRLKSLMFLMLLVGANAQMQGQETTAPTTPEPVNLDFNEQGVATVDLKDIVVTGNTPENVIWDPSTGKITSKGGDWSLTLYLDDERFANVTTVKIETEIPQDELDGKLPEDNPNPNYKQNDVISCISIFPSDSQTRVGGGWYSSKYNFDYSSVWTNDTNIPQRTYQELGPVVDRFVIETNGQVGEMTIKSITITKKLLRGGKEVALTTDDFKRWTGPDADVSAEEAIVTETTPGCEYPIGIEKENGAVIFGNSNVSRLEYADLSNYDVLKIKFDKSGISLRVQFNRIYDAAAQNQDGVTIEVNPVTDEEGIAIVNLKTDEKLKDCKYIHLNSIKLNWGAPVTTLESITLSKNDVDYIFMGAGDLTSEGKTLLADENATLIDATGVTKATDQIKFANPNCLYIANKGILANESNVLIADENGGYTCANLVLETGKAFRAPFDFTANLASMTKTVAESGFATLVLPYAVNNVTAGKVYELTDVNGTVVNGDPVTTIEANKPVLLNAGNYKLTASNVTIEANPASMTNGALTGVYDATTVIPEGSYVLQNQTNEDGWAFYYVNENSGDDAIKMTPFTAYLSNSGNQANVNMLTFNFNDEVTGIENVEAATSAATVVEIYDLSGRKVSAPVKGINLMKMSDGTVKKVIVK